MNSKHAKNANLCYHLKNVSFVEKNPKQTSTKCKRRTSFVKVWQRQKKKVVSQWSYALIWVEAWTVHIQPNTRKLTKIMLSEHWDWKTSQPFQVSYPKQKS